MEYVVISACGKQFKVRKGDTFVVGNPESLNVGVLFYTDGKKTLVGTPFVKDISVKTEIVKKSYKKTDVARFKAKSRYHRKYGHKQPAYTVRVASITHKEKVAKPDSEKKAKSSKENK